LRQWRGTVERLAPVAAEEGQLLPGAVPTRTGGGGGAGKNYRDSAVRKEARGFKLLHTCLSFSAVSLFVDLQISFFSDQAQVNLQLRISLSDLVYSFLSGSPLLEGPIKLFSPWSQCVLGNPDKDGNTCSSSNWKKAVDKVGDYTEKHLHFQLCCDIVM
jgi:hypothetical protein